MHQSSSSGLSSALSSYKTIYIIGYPISRKLSDSRKYLPNNTFHKLGITYNVFFEHTSTLVQPLGNIPLKKWCMYFKNIFPHAANIIHDNYSTCLSSFSSNIIGSRYLLIGIHNMRRKGKPRDAGVSLIAHSNASNISCIEVNKCIFRVLTQENSSPQLL